MKFSKVLAEFASTEGGSDEEQTAHPSFLSYKTLKKQLKAAADRQEQILAAHHGEDYMNSGLRAPNGNNMPAGSLPVTDEERQFVATLQGDLRRINAYFMEKEEEAIIKLQALNDRRDLVGAGKHEELRAAFADFHGEMVLLLHWSMVNYAGVAKILKKHDKMLKGHGQKACLANILQQPFVSTENISKLVKEAEARVQELCTRSNEGGYSGIEGGTDVEEARLLKRTRAALGMLSQLTSNAHTPSTLLNPATVALQTTDAEQDTTGAHAYENELS